MRRLIALGVLCGAVALAAPGCPPQDLSVCDAGDEQFVRRTVPLLLGRHPRSVAEVEVFAALAARDGREAFVRTLAASPEYRAHWTHVLYDQLGVERVGMRSNQACYDQRLIPDVGEELAAWVRDGGPDGASFLEPWTMADLADSALQLDDLSVLYRAQLFTMLSRDKPPVDPDEGHSQSKNYLGVFESTWLDREMACVACHNGAFSTTDHEDPELDRTWRVDGFFEQAIFGAHEGRPPDDVAALFRRRGVVGGVRYFYLPQGDSPAGDSPWGIDENCGTYVPPEEVWEDPLGLESFFIEPLGVTGSVWDLERHLDAGVRSLRSDGLTLDGGAVSGPQAFAWLNAMAIVNDVHEHAVGSRLTVPHHFSRNAAQRDRLQALTEAFVGDSFSLQAVLVGITTDPTWNLDAPAECMPSTERYGLPAIFDPWTVDRETDPRLNSMGDQVRPLGVRERLGATIAAMGWEAPPAFFNLELDPGATAMTAMGAFMKDSDPGFREIDFQAALAWEDVFGGCSPPTSINEPDTVSRILATADADTPLGDALATLKDRLLADPVIEDPEEIAALEAVAGASMDTPLRDLDDVFRSMRAVCGGWLMGPHFLFGGLPGPDRVGTAPPITLPGETAAELCAELETEVGALDCAALLAVD